MADRKSQTTPNKQEGDSTSTSGNPDRDNQTGQERTGQERQGQQRQGQQREGQSTERTGTERTDTDRNTDMPERSDRTSEEGSTI
jgi:hypothetical protein